MTLPANIRVNTQAPFPALVRGSGLITLSKTSGIWTIGFSITQLGTVVPSAADLNTNYVIIYNSVTGAFSKSALSNIPNVLAQRSFTASPIVPTVTDVALNININAGGPTCTLPLASSRNGLPLIFKDAGGHATAHPITITATLPDTIDGAAFVTLSLNFQSVTLNPFNDGVNAGWYIT